MADMELQSLVQNAEDSPELTVVLLGHAGVGKSASGNTILQKPNAFESKLSFRSVTTEISEQTGRVGGQSIRVVDTPAILDKNKQEEVRAFCQELIQTNKHYVFLFVLRIGRFTPEQHDALKAAIDAVGEEGQRRSMLLFTAGDTLGDMTLDQFINEDPDNPLVNIVQQFGDRTHVFNNNNTQRGQPQVQELFRKAMELPEVNIGKELGMKEVRLVLFGLPGAGKSSSGNTILGSQQFKRGCDFNSVSTETQTESAVVNGQKVTVVDTPGFTDKVLTPKQWYYEIGKSILQADPGPHAFVIVVRIGRISKRDSEFFKLITKLFDKELRYFMVLFTYGDELEGQNIEDKAKSNPTVKKLLSKCGKRYSVFNNKQRGNLSQVQNLLRVIDQMNNENNGEPYTLEMMYKNHLADTEVSKTAEKSNQYALDIRNHLLSPDNLEEHKKAENMDGEKDSKYSPYSFFTIILDLIQSFFVWLMGYS